MKSGGSITVDGTFKGNLSVQTLLIGAGGYVDGTVTADSINVKGKLSGTVSCRDLVIGGRATVDGALNYSSITIQRGGTIKGDLKRK
jgi:cytoskeletal protein CcmA (bactofilin family)